MNFPDKCPNCGSVMTLNSKNCVSNCKDYLCDSRIWELGKFEVGIRCLQNQVDNLKKQVKRNFNDISDIFQKLKISEDLQGLDYTVLDLSESVGKLETKLEKLKNRFNGEPW